MEKNVRFIAASQVDTGTVPDEQSVLRLGELGFSAAVQSRNKQWTRAPMKEEITHLYCKTPAPCTTLGLIISSTRKGDWPQSSDTGAGSQLYKRSTVGYGLHIFFVFELLFIYLTLNVIEAFSVPRGWKTHMNSNLARHVFQILCIYLKYPCGKEKVFGKGRQISEGDWTSILILRVWPLSYSSRLPIGVRDGTSWCQSPMTSCAAVRS